MTRIFAMLLFASCSSTCWAGDGDVRPLENVFADSSVIIRGAVIGSGIGACGDKNGVSSHYTFRTTSVIKGDVQDGDIKACGAAPLLLGNQYIIAGDRRAVQEIVFSPDAVLLVFPTNEYYRLISYDGPLVTSDRGEAYAVGILEPDFLKRFGRVIAEETKVP